MTAVNDFTCSVVSQSAATAAARKRMRTTTAAMSHLRQATANLLLFFLDRFRPGCNAYGACRPESLVLCLFLGEIENALVKELLVCD
jgi:hypothetical protein